MPNAVDILKELLPYCEAYPKLALVLLVLVGVWALLTFLGSVLAKPFPKLAAKCRVGGTDVLAIIKWALLRLKGVSKVTTVSVIIWASAAGITFASASGCAWLKKQTPTILTANSSDGKHWQWCFKFKQDAVAQFEELACADSSVLIQQRRAQQERSNPKTVFGPIYQAR